MKRQTWQTPVSYMANHRMVGWNLPTVGSGGSTEGPEPKNFERRLDEHVATWVPNLPQSRWTFRGLVEGVEPRVDLMEQVAWKPQQKGIWIGIRWHWGSLNISILHFDILWSYSQGGRLTVDSLISSKTKTFATSVTNFLWGCHERLTWMRASGNIDFSYQQSHS